MSNSYWGNTGKYNKFYSKLYDELVPLSGNAQTTDGELLRIISKIYYRYYNDGDSYDYLLETWGPYISISNIKGLEEYVARNIEYYLEDNDQSLEKAVNIAMEYLIIKRSTKDKILNPFTNRLVKIDTPSGLKILKMLNCNIIYNHLDSSSTDSHIVDKIVKHSSDTKVWNPTTTRMVKLDSPLGINILKNHGFNVSYQHNYR